jgi:hypothetical protein
MPRMQARPPMIWESNVMRSNMGFPLCFHSATPGNIALSNYSSSRSLGQSADRTLASRQKSGLPSRIDGAARISSSSRFRRAMASRSQPAHVACGRSYVDQPSSVKIERIHQGTVSPGGEIGISSRKTGEFKRAFVVTPIRRPVTAPAKVPASARKIL